MKPLAVSPGDPAGVGPEIAVRAIVDRPDESFLVTGDADWLGRRFAELGREARVYDGRPPARGEVALVHCADWTEAVGYRATAAGGRSQLAALDRAADLVVAGEAAALVTGPTSKEAVVLGGTAFTGQTEHLAARAGLERDAVTMLFLGPRLSVGLVTTHLSIREAPDAISPPRVARTLNHLIEALQRGGKAQPTIAVAGLNPHAGEGGLFGDEEMRAIAPACEPRPDAVVRGPLGAETAFRLAAAGEVDGVVAMLHDQATIASKLLDWGRAVNVTWGLPYVRASVDHGVAYDAAAAGRADPQGMSAAVAAARVLGPAETFAENF